MLYTLSMANFRDSVGTLFRGQRLPLTISVVLAAALALGLLTMTASLSDNPEPQQRSIFFTIATGSVAGTYYPVGELLANIISSPRNAIHCEDPSRCGPPGLTAVAQASGGSVRNVRQVHAGLVSSALAQADIVSLAYVGKAPFADEGPFNDLRAIAKLYSETIHLVVAKDADITSLADLRGHRVSVDTTQSGTYSIARAILDAADIRPPDVSLMSVSVDEAAELMVDGVLDAFFYVAGYPVPIVDGLVALDVATLIPLNGPTMDQLRAKKPYFAQAVIPAGTYDGLPEIRTLSVGALWITNASLDNDLVFAITRALWHEQNLMSLAAGHPKGAQVQLTEATDGIPIPLHDGAARFYASLDLETTSAALSAP